MAEIHMSDVKTRIFLKGTGDTYVLDFPVWPQCGVEFPAHGSGGDTTVQSTVMGEPVNAMNLLFTDDDRAFIDVMF